MERLQPLMFFLKIKKTGLWEIREVENRKIEAFQKSYKSSAVNEEIKGILFPQIDLYKKAAPVQKRLSFYCRKNQKL
jgi:hypothetical protein